MGDLVELGELMQSTATRQEHNALMVLQLAHPLTAVKEAPPESPAKKQGAASALTLPFGSPGGSSMSSGLER